MTRARTKSASGVRRTAGPADARRQINLRVDDEFMAAVEVIQRAHSPLLERSEAVRAAVLAHARTLAGRK